MKITTTANKFTSAHFQHLFGNVPHTLKSKPALTLKRELKLTQHQVWKASLII